MKNNTAQRVALFRANQKALGRLKKEFYATPLEHEFLKAELSAFRLRAEARKLVNETK